MRATTLPTPKIARSSIQLVAHLIPIDHLECKFERWLWIVIPVQFFAVLVR